MIKETTFINAIRNGVTRRFPKQIWDNMGTDKYGWNIVINKPSDAIIEQIKRKENQDVIITNEDDLLSNVNGAKRGRKPKEDGKGTNN